MDKQKNFNKIFSKDRVFGKLCREASRSYENESYFAALACLFIIAEQIVKYALDKNNGNYSECLIEANKKEIINGAEFTILNNLRYFRNIIFHENHYSLGIEIEGTYYPFDEDETKKVVYDKFSQPIFGLVEKIVSNNND